MTIEKAIEILGELIRNKKTDKYTEEEIGLALEIAICNMQANYSGEGMGEFEKETLKFFEDIVSYCTENHACISVDNTIIEYFKVAIKAIRQNIES